MRLLPTIRSSSNQLSPYSAFLFHSLTVPSSLLDPPPSSRSLSLSSLPQSYCLSLQNKRSRQFPAQPAIVESCFLFVVANICHPSNFIFLYSVIFGPDRCWKIPFLVRSESLVVVLKIGEPVSARM